MLWTFPLLLSYTLDIRTSRGGNTRPVRRLHVDLSGVQQIDSLGLAAFAANLAKGIEGHPEFEVQTIPPVTSTVRSFLSAINLPELLLSLGMNVNRSLDFLSPSALPLEAWHHVRAIDIGRTTETFIFIPASEPDTRETTLRIALGAIKAFFKRNPASTINYGQVGPILHEIIKNALDHSEAPGLLALRIGPNHVGRRVLFFMHCEMGDGISLNVRDFLAMSKDSEEARLAQRGSTADFLHWAFTPGKSTKLHRGVNAGLGLASIRAAAKGGNIRVYCSDAKSLAYITEFPVTYTHKELRKRLYHTHPFPAFMFFGETQ